MDNLNIYLCGVGGQGIGVLSAVLTQACLAAGHQVMGADTHGLAQRGGIVVSHLRLGRGVFTPRITAGQAGLVVALERLEAYRAICNMLQDGGTAVYYDSSQQPIAVRLGKSEYPSNEDLQQACAKRNCRLERVELDNLPDHRMQNVALLGRIAQLEIIPGVTPEVLDISLRDILPAHALEQNLEVFKRAGETVATG